MAKLGDVCRVIVDGDWIESKDQSENGIRLIQTGNIGIGEYLDKSNRAKYITPETFERLKCTEVLPGDILISRLPDPIGRACIVPKTVGKAITAVDCTVVRLETSLCDTNYFVNYTQSIRYSNELSKFLAGTTRTRISRKNLEKIEIPLPSIDRQRKIAAQLDKVSDLIAKHRAQLDKLDLLVKARFVEMFGDFKVNSKGWPVVSFRDIARIDANMTTDYKKYADYPHIGIDCIEKETGMLKGYRTVAEDGVISGKYIFTPKHIIYSKIRPNLNKVALPDFDGLCSADAYPILPIEGKCNRIFLAYDMRSAFFLDYILQYCNRTNLPKVNRKEVEGFNTPLPPLDLQSRFACFVEQTEKTKTNIKQSLEMLETLKKALMQEFFG